MTIDTQELRQLAQAALIGPDGVSMRWLKLLKDFQEEANPAAISELLDRLEAAEKAADELGSLERYRTAYNEWVDKTEWVQADTSLPVKYFGMHRADVLKDMISELKERCDELSADKDTWYRMSEVFSKRITEVEDALKASEERCAVLTDALRLAVRQNSHDMLMTAEELRSCEAALEETK